MATAIKDGKRGAGPFRSRHHKYIVAGIRQIVKRDMGATWWPCCGNATLVLGRVLGNKGEFEVVLNRPPGCSAFAIDFDYG